MSYERVENTYVREASALLLVPTKVGNAKASDCWNGHKYGTHALFYKLKPTRKPGGKNKQMKKLVILTMMAFSCLIMLSRDFEAGGIWYTVIDDTLKTCRTREGGATSENFTGELRIPENVSDGTSDYTVVEIGASSFKDCQFTNTKFVHNEIPASVKVIQSEAFQNTNIEYLMLPEDGVEEIGSHAFRGRSDDQDTKNPTYVYLPKSLRQLGQTNQLREVFNPYYKGRPLIISPQSLKLSSTANATVQSYQEHAKWDGDCLYVETDYGRQLLFVSWAVEGTLIIPDTYTSIRNRYRGYQNLYTILPPTITGYDYTTHGFIGITAARASYRYPAGTSFAADGSVFYYSDKAEIGNGYIYDSINLKSLLRTYYNNAAYTPEMIAQTIYPYLPEEELLSLVFTTPAITQHFSIKEGTELIMGCLTNISDVKSVTLPSSLKHVYNSFINLNSLHEIILPEGLETITYSFSQIRNLKEISIPKSTIFINGAFTECALEEVTLHDGMFVASGFSHNYNEGISNGEGEAYRIPSLRKITFGNNINYIGGFENIAAEEIIIPEGTTAVAGFNNSSFIKNISLPNSLEYIGYSFYGNPELQFISIPESVNTFFWAGGQTYPPSMQFNSKIPPANVGNQEAAGEGMSPSPEIVCIVPDGSMMVYAESFPYCNLKLKTLSGTTPYDYDDEIYRYRVYEDSKEAMLLGKISATPTSTLSFPSRIPVETEAGTVFYNVSGIEREAFASDTSLEKIILPNSLKYIGTKAFYHCTALKDFDFPHSLENIGISAFGECISIETINLFHNIKEIGQHAFNNCSNLKEAIFTEGPQTIKSATFQNCSSLAKIKFPSSLKKIEQNAFYKSAIEHISFSYGLEYISSSAFYQCKSLQSAELPTSLKYIGSNAFAYDNNLTQLKLPEGLEEIHSGAFNSCASLKEITLPASLDKIYQNAFINCDSLEYIKLADTEKPLIPLPENGSTDNSKAYLWQRLKMFHGAYPSKLYIGRPTDINSIRPDEEIDDDGAMYEAPVVTPICAIDSLQSLTIGNLVKIVGPYSAFFGAKKLTDLKLGTNLEIIGSSAFSNCNLSEVIIPSNVKDIRNYAFRNNNITKITIGAGIERVGQYVFDGCNGVENIYVTAITPPTAYNNTFSWYGGSLFVTPGCRESYENNPNCWYRFSNYDLIEADKVSISYNSIDIEEGVPIQLTAAISPDNATLQTILWESSDPSIATVDGDGLVTFIGTSGNQNGKTREMEAAQQRGSLDIRAYTLYANTPIAVCKVNYTLSGIESIEVEDFPSKQMVDYSKPFKVITLQGIDVTENFDRLSSGIYIVLQNGQSHKIAK